MPSEIPNCGVQVLKERFLIQYIDGSVNVVHGDKAFVEEYIVSPNLEIISRVEYDQVLPPLEFFNELNTQSGSIDNWALERIDVESAWQLGYRGDGIVVAVIDSGVDINHPLLVNQIAYNSGEMGLDEFGQDKRSNQIDDDGNGFIDDYAGYNFYDDSPLMMGDTSHGTHVAGIISTDHSETEVTNSMILGAAPGVKILPIRFLDSDGGTISDAIASLEYAKNLGADLVNASWGGKACSKIMDEKIKSLSDAGIPVIVAAGNSGSNLDFFPEFPAAFENPLQITVGATGRLNGKMSFSNYSRNYVHLFAPGFEIPSTLPNSSYGSISGTSMATPFVTASMAILMSARPDLSPEVIQNVIFSNVVSHPSYANKTEGRLHLGAALGALGL